MAIDHAVETRNVGVGSTPIRHELDETKASFQTTELWVAVAAVIGIWITTQMLHNVDAWDGLRLITVVVVGYVVSRGLAKAGSRHADA